METTYRLKRTIEPFLAADNTLYLLRGGADADFAVADAPPPVVGLLELLEQEEARTPAQLSAALGISDEDVGQALGELERAGLLETPHDSGADLERYARQMLYFADVAPLPAASYQRRLARARVVVLGVGGLGSWVATSLACAGVGQLVLVDGDRVELANLNRQTLFGEHDIGRPKVEVAAAALRAFNRTLAIETIDEFVTSPGALDPLVMGADLVVCAADWPAYQVGRWVNEVCWRHGIPWITGGQFPPHLRVGPLYVPGVTGCLTCMETAARRAFPDYDALAAQRERAPKPGATLGASSAWVASGIALNVIHQLTGVAPAAAQGRAFLLDMRTFEMRTDIIGAEAGCPTCG